MNDVPVEWARDRRVISTDRARLDAATILGLLGATHWGGDLTPDRLARAIEHSLCFGVYEEDRLVGFGRVVTDLTTFGYLTDVVIAPSHRGRGLGRWLTDCMVAHPGLQGVRRLALLTRDAESLYRKAGFEPGPAPLVYLEHRSTLSPRAGSASRR
ncbi:MAG: GNAT family N-acetyltransferase [Gemmatimonadales bacterium]